MLDHQYTTLSGYRTSVEEFYKSIEEDLAAKRLGGLSISRVEYAEGGPLSAQRTYLRMQRERLVFDVCASPFGETFFFSYRFSEIPCSLRVWEFLVLLALLAGVTAAYGALFGWLMGPALFVLTVLGVAILMRNALALGLHDIDASLLRIPVMGGVYEALFRRETYYREDTRLAYLHIVRATILDKVDEATAAKGVKLVEFHPASQTSGPEIARLLSAMLRAR